jgi:hypothetical protein
MKNASIQLKGRQSVKTPSVSEKNCWRDAPLSVGLLRVVTERPHIGTASKRYELPPPHSHSITSSARINGDGIARRSVLAALMLMIKLNGCSTGRSNGFIGTGAKLTGS